ncbi:MAG: hypothetical protein H7X89_15800 [Rhizobiales bacterium]|nr:hypothetical protein [Hyphomicrobiales bacterium]
MATVLFTWELGLGLGHLVQIRTACLPLIERGHRVVVAACHLANAQQVFAGYPVEIVRAPRVAMPRKRLLQVATYAHLLHNIGFGDGPTLLAATTSWRQLILSVCPDAIVFDHSPTALLASTGLGMKRAIIGNGFCQPPQDRPLPVLRPWRQWELATAPQDEARLLGHMNDALHRFNVPPLSSMAEIYRGFDQSILTTIELLDPFAPRTGKPDYLGVFTIGDAPPPQWPAGPGKRVFGYLKPFPALPVLLEALAKSHLPALFFCPTVDEAFRARYHTAQMQLLHQPVDILRACSECDFVIGSGTHATALHALEAGKPALHIPLVLEPVLVSYAVEQAGAGLMAAPDNTNELVDQFNRLITDPSLEAGAKRFLQPAECHQERLARLSRQVLSLVE